ncbi:hypothetical protein ACH5RR_030159 [Cinchona calisaya]|uniref:Cotton fiber protein n=1 Tax=Cinchona calisaya TaxID=153742 RepID=A0ABD2YV01_9GENT
MPKKLKSSTALLQKVSRILKVPILIARMRKSISISGLISLKKSRKIKKLMLLKHYNNGYIQEYQFSPSSSPFLHYHYRKPIKKRRYKDLYSIFFIGKCLGMIKAEKEYRGYPAELKNLPSIENTFARELYHETSELSGEEDDEYSIDERAEKFIERFYEEMRMQKQELLLQFNPLMLDVDS